MADKLIGACVIGQSGGPTSVINASVYGTIVAALESDCITQILGSEHGIIGVLDDTLYDLGLEDPEELNLLKYTPSASLGSCRYKLAAAENDDTDYKRILEVFKKHNIRYFFYNGGNDSMDTCDKISRYLNECGWECRVIGIPKTIDNDLVGTDHCPGFASAAKYIATSTMEVSMDNKAYPTGQVTIMEIMGRHAGWLAGSAGIGSRFGAGPDLVYLPEIDFNENAFLDDVERIYREKGDCLVIVSEGLRFADGSFVSGAETSSTDGFGHAQLNGLVPTLEKLAKDRTGAKVRGIEVSLLQRCSIHMASLTDLEEAEIAGRAAVEAALAGENGMMVAFERDETGGHYACRTVLQPLSSVANKEKMVPREWINDRGNFVTDEFINYVLPLLKGRPELPEVQSMPRYAHLKKIRV